MQILRPALQPTSPKSASTVLVRFAVQSASHESSFNRKELGQRCQHLHVKYSTSKGKNKIARLRFRVRGFGHAGNYGHGLPNSSTRGAAAGRGTQAVGTRQGLGHLGWGILQSYSLRLCTLLWKYRTSLWDCTSIWESRS